MNMNEVLPDNFDGMTINIAQVAKNKESLSVTRMLAMTIMRQPYMTVGDFMRDLSDTDLQTLLEGSDTEENGEVLFEDILLIAMMLHQAEGLESIQTDEKATEVANIFVNYLACEGLARKGMVKIYRENMSFGDDCAEKIVVEKI
jgi:hypothetical protein